MDAGSRTVPDRFQLEPIGRALVERQSRRANCRLRERAGDRKPRRGAELEPIAPGQGAQFCSFTGAARVRD
jgi:hypothetical protein